CAESGREFLVRLAQRRLRVDPELARQVGDGEKKVSHLFFRARLIRRRVGNDLSQLVYLLLDLSDHVARALPIEADRCSTYADLIGTQQRWQCPRNAAEQRFGIGGGPTLMRLDLFPLRAYLALRVEPRLVRLAA